MTGPDDGAVGCGVKPSVAPEGEGQRPPAWHLWSDPASSKIIERGMTTVLPEGYCGMNHVEIRDTVWSGTMCLQGMLAAQGSADLARRLDCTPASLAVADDILSFLPFNSRIAFLVGAYVGAVLQKHNDGYWSVDCYFQMTASSMNPWSAVECKLKLGTSIAYSYALATKPQLWRSRSRRPNPSTSTPPAAARKSVCAAQQR